MSLQNPKVVLVVDDNADARNSLAILLRLFGIATATAGDGREALVYLRNHPPPCLIVLDLRMPGMDGFQFRDEQRRDPAISNIPVVVCSGEHDMRLADLGDIRAFCRKGADPMRLVHLVLSQCV
jgi:CheY-like chemotaxis protein